MPKRPRRWVTRNSWLALRLLLLLQRQNLRQCPLPAPAARGFDRSPRSLPRPRLPILLRMDEFEVKMKPEVFLVQVSSWLIQELAAVLKFCVLGTSIEKNFLQSFRHMIS